MEKNIITQEDAVDIVNLVSIQCLYDSHDLLGHDFICGDGKVSEVVFGR